MYISVWVLFWVWADAEVRRPVGTHQTWGIRQYWFRLTLYAHLLQVMICNSVLGEGVAGQPAPTNVPVGRPVHGMGCIFSSSRNQSTFIGFWLMSFFSTLASILPSHLVTYWPIYLIDLATVLTYILSLPTNQQPTPRPPLPTILLSFHWFNFYLLSKNLYLFLAKPLLLEQTYIFSWFNL